MDRVEENIQVLSCLSLTTFLEFDSDLLRYLSKQHTQAFFLLTSTTFQLAMRCIVFFISWGTQRGSDSKLKKSSIFQAYWASVDGKMDKDATKLSTGHIEFFFK